MKCKLWLFSASSFSRKCLIDYSCASILDPEKWNLERKKSDTPDAGPKGGDNGENRVIFYLIRFAVNVNFS